MTAAAWVWIWPPQPVGKAREPQTVWELAQRWVAGRPHPTRRSRRVGTAHTPEPCRKSTVDER